MEITFNGKRALVTGGGRGVGRAVATALVKGGATVFALDLDQENLASLKAEFPNITTLCIDLTDWDATRKAVQNILPIDLLANIAGIVHRTHSLDALPDDFDHVMNTNVKQALNISQVVAREMIHNKSGGAILNVSSIQSMCATPNSLIYSASKSALNQITRVLALELGPHNIRVNAIMPCLIRSQMSVEIHSNPEKSDAVVSRVPMGRMNEIQDVLGPILFLLSDKAKMINGVLLPVDGGYMAC